MPTALAKKQMEPIIKTDNLSVIYFLGRSNQVDALVNANIEIYPGEFIIFFGPSGCGKSTLLYAIAGLERNIQGHVSVDGSDISRFSTRELESHHQKTIGMIFQAYYLINSLSIIQNVTLPQFSLNAPKKSRDSAAYELMERFGIKPQAQKYPNELSGGQQQRAAVCRALINNPEIILADEPTGNLDSKVAGDVMGLLQRLNEEEGKTVILVTHSPQFLHYAHRVFFMKDGKIIDIKVNKPMKVAAKMPTVLDSAAKLKLYRELELLAKTYPSFSASKFGELLIPFKAQEIAVDSLANITMEEMEQVAKYVEKMLLLGVERDDGFFEYLDKNIEAGGLGLDRRTAQKITREIKQVVKEIKRLQKKELDAAKGLPYDEDEEIKALRHYLLESFDIKLAHLGALEIFNKALRDRLEDVIGAPEFQKMLDLPVMKGGAGLDKRTAWKVARRLELLMLGKFSENPPVRLGKKTKGEISGHLFGAEKKLLLPPGRKNIILDIADEIKIIFIAIGKKIGDFVWKPYFWAARVWYNVRMRARDWRQAAWHLAAWLKYYLRGGYRRREAEKSYFDFLKKELSQHDFQKCEERMKKLRDKIRRIK